MDETQPANLTTENMPSISGNEIHSRLYDHLPVAVYTCNRLGYITFFNKAAERLWGRTPEIGRDLWCGSWKIYTTEGIPISLDNCPMAVALKKGIPLEGEQIIIERPDGVRVKVRPYPVPVFDDHGELTGAVNTLIDVTELVDNEGKQAVLAAIVNTSDDAIISKTLQGNIISWNRGAEQIFGYTEAEVLGKHISILIPENRLQEEDVIIGRIAQGKKVDHFETIRLTKAGREIPVSLSVSPIMDRSGKIIGASKIARDISVQKSAQEAAERHIKNLRTINAMAKMVSEELNLKQLLQKVTDATTQLIGAAYGVFFYKAVDTAGESSVLYSLSGVPVPAVKKLDLPVSMEFLQDIFPDETVVRINDITKIVPNGRNASYYDMLSGQLQIASYLAVPVADRLGTIVGGLLFGHPDAGVFTKEHEMMVTAIASHAAIGIDNARLYEEVKALNEKKNEFIGLASHELKTPLTSISGYLQILERQNTDVLGKNFMSKAMQQIRKLTALISDLLDVSKIEAGKLRLSKERFDIRSLLEDTIDLVQYTQNSHKITLDTTVEKTILYADAQRIEQVVVNLLTNAIKYAPAATHITVLLERQDQEVKVGVKDAGPGIAPDQLSLIFSRFYRVENSNATVSGLGIGLYLSHEIIERHQGRIWVESELGKGSTFWFALPA
ncbi:PAS domain S-box protein [Pedobacter sp. BS3]|uniref:sensor histidine kinase n=1 Tax=Pedobacter sp. BS3 TaxID=2567937 RepID=UPI0011ED0DD0|nr:PAS domain S-box protein [Pedobacter sp. BS3]TZF83105.1 PAS domain S-box protein [Pedobacter sp. BS3]